MVVLTICLMVSGVGRAAKLAGMGELRAIIIPRPTKSELLVKKVSRLTQTKTLSFPKEVNALEEGLRALNCHDDQSKWPRGGSNAGCSSPSS